MAPAFWKKAQATDPKAAEGALAEFVAERLRANPNDLDALAAAGTYFLERGKADDALKCFHRITRTDPRYPGVWSLKAEAFDAVGDPKNAEQCRKRDGNSLS